MSGNSESMREQVRRDSVVDDPATLERRSDAIRRDMGQTLDALQRNYSPGALLDRSIDLFKEHGGEVGTNLGRAVRENPMPVLLTLVGVGWMILSQNRRTGAGAAEGTTSTGVGTAGAYDAHPAFDATTGIAPIAGVADPGGDGSTSGGVGAKVSDTLGSAREGVRSAKDAAMNSMRGGAQRVAEGSQRVAERAREQSQRAKQGFQTMLEEQPLVVGALGVALGAVIGALIPESERERRAFGESRQRLVGRAKELGAQGYAKARDTAQQAVEGARGAVQGGGGSGGSGSGSGSGSGGGGGGGQGGTSSSTSSMPDPSSLGNASSSTLNSTSTLGADRPGPSP